MPKPQKRREKVSKSENSVIKPDKRSKKKKKFILTEAAPYPSEKGERLAALLREALLYTANEPVLLIRSEEFFSPKPANLKIDRPLRIV